MKFYVFFVLFLEKTLDEEDGEFLFVIFYFL